MTKLVIRHGLSEANNYENFGTPAFGHPQAPLMEKALPEARELRTVLVSHYAINPVTTVAATSKMLRTRQTAQAAGFERTVAYASLDEVRSGLAPDELGKLLEVHKLPAAAIASAEALLNEPPQETVWFTHGLVISGLCHVLGVCADQRFIPKFLEIRELPVD